LETLIKSMKISKEIPGMLAMLVLLSVMVVMTLTAPMVWAGTAPSQGAGTGMDADESDAGGSWDNAQLFEHVTGLARERAGRTYREPDASVSGTRANAPSNALANALAAMDYSAYRDIRFRPDRALWHKQSLFEVQLFHPGFLYRQPVTLHVLEDGQLRTVDFDPAMFRYDGAAAEVGVAAADAHAAGTDASLGHAGFRLHYPINSAEYKDEFLVFLGASYFRLVGRDQNYGLSSRGLAIDTGAPGGEEFPVFREFWLLRPDPGATRMTVIALLDSPSVSGAYRFTITPGADTEVAVESRLFARRDIGKLGVAPLTSMYFQGAASVRRHDDFRPQVHDSDGLLMHGASGEWIWRPLSNPLGLRFSSLQDREPRGFGLVQRERRFDNYLDMEADYHRRPSQWVRLGTGDWGEGGVELVEIPTDSETNDNIVTYWTPRQPFRAGEQRRYDYTLSTFGSRLAWQDQAEVVRTRSGWAAIPGESDPPPRGVRRFIVDFRGGALDGLAADQPLESSLEISAGRVTDLQLRPLADGEGWRASFKLTPEAGAAADMRLFLSLRGARMSETWTYVWYPDEL